MMHYDNFIDGKFVPATGNGKMTVINPSDGKPVCTVPDSTAADVHAAVAAATVAQKEWAKRPAIERAKVLHCDCRQDPRNVEPLARVITEEQGKTLGAGARGSRLHRRLHRLHGRMGAPHRGRDPRERPPGRDHLPLPAAHRRDRRHPALELPLLPDRPQSRARRWSPATPSSSSPARRRRTTPSSSANCIAEADLPPGVINIVHGRGPSVGKALASSPRVGMISFTGSVETGSRS